MQGYPSKAGLLLNPQHSWGWFSLSLWQVFQTLFGKPARDLAELGKPLPKLCLGLVAQTSFGQPTKKNQVNLSWGLEVCAFSKPLAKLGFCYSPNEVWAKNSKLEKNLSLGFLSEARKTYLLSPQLRWVW